MTDNTRRNGPTRRATIKYGGTVVSGGLLAGCTGGSEESTPETDPTTNESYSVTMEQMGTVEFDDPPETWTAFLSTYGDMGIALGKADGLRGLWDPETMPTAFYDALPGVDVSFEDITPIAQDGEFDKEIFYELDADVHLMDPNWLGVLNDDWSEDDAEEIADNVGPFLGNYIRRRGDDWHDYEYYSLYEAFEVVAEAFDERERYEAFTSVHDDAQATIDDSLPPTEERPTVGLVSVNSDFEDGSFYVYPVQEGNNHKQ